MLSEVWSTGSTCPSHTIYITMLYVHVHKNDDQPILTIDVSID